MAIARLLTVKVHTSTACGISPDTVKFKGSVLCICLNALLKGASFDALNELAHILSQPAVSSVHNKLKKNCMRTLCIQSAYFSMLHLCSNHHGATAAAPLS